MHTFLTSAPDEGEWLSSSTGCFIPSPANQPKLLITYLAGWIRSAQFKAQKNLLPSLGIESQFFGCQACSLVTVETTLLILPTTTTTL